MDYVLPHLYRIRQKGFAIDTMENPKKIGLGVDFFRATVLTKEILGRQPNTFLIALLFLKIMES